MLYIVLRDQRKLFAFNIVACGTRRDIYDPLVEIVTLKLRKMTQQEEFFYMKAFDGRPTSGKNSALGKCLLPESYSNVAERIRSAPVRKDDVWLVSYPRTGSTWCQEMIWLIQNNLDFQTAQTDLQQLRAPLIECSEYLFEHVDSINQIPRYKRLDARLDNLPDSIQNTQMRLQKLFTDSIGYVEDLPSPRCIKSHLPIELLPEEILTVKPKMIYTMRNPKDLCVSFYFHCQMLHKFKMEFETFCELFLKGALPIGSVFHHYFGFWNKRNEMDILILRYEEMRTDTRGTVKKIAKFLEKPLTDEDVDAICEFLSFENMRGNKAANLQVLIDNTHGKEFYNKSGTHFIRKGIIGDHKNHMSAEMIDRFDKWIEANTKGSDLAF